MSERNRKRMNGSCGKLPATIVSVVVVGGLLAGCSRTQTKRESEPTPDARISGIPGDYPGAIIAVQGMPASFTGVLMRFS